MKKQKRFVRGMAFALTVTLLTVGLSGCGNDGEDANIPGLNEPVGVDIDTMSQVEALLKMHHLDGLTKRGFKSRNL